MFRNYPNLKKKEAQAPGIIQIYIQQRKLSLPIWIFLKASVLEAKHKASGKSSRKLPLQGIFSSTKRKKKNQPKEIEGGMQTEKKT